MERSANGWPVLADPPPAATIPGTVVRLRVKPGPVATVLLEVASRFHREVEELTLPVREDPQYDDWGWAYRPVRGQTTGFSNHASGTAIDLNATLHPRGRSDTFAPAQVRALRRILASTYDDTLGRNVVRWGGDYTTVPDEMHFEINGPSAAVDRVADRIIAKRAEQDRDPMEEIMATPAERDALARQLAPLVAPLVAQSVTAAIGPQLKALLARGEDGLYVRAKGTRAVYQILAGHRVWTDPDDYTGAGRPEVQELDPGHELLKLPLIGQRPTAGSE